MQKQELISITGYELFTILVILCSTIAFLVAPGPIYSHVHTASWYIPILALVPGLFYTFIYQSLLKNSPYPLPRMMEHYWGQALGWLLGILYACFFLIWAALWVRLFLDFQLSVINPMQPISVLVAGILIVALYALRKGLTTTIRALEMIFLIVVLFTIILIVLGLFQTDFSRLLPLYHTNLLNLINNTLFFSRFYAVTGLVLILGHFINNQNKAGNSARYALLFTAILMTLIIMVTIGVIGNLIVNDAYPIFDMVRRLRIGTFIRNMDAFFITVWFTGTFFGIFTLWFAFIFTLQGIFRLQDYRPLAPATIIMVGITAIALGPNALIVKNLQYKVVYPLIMIFLAIIPFLTWIIGLARGKIRLKPTSAQTAKS